MHAFLYGMLEGLLIQTSQEAFSGAHYCSSSGLVMDESQLAKALSTSQLYHFFKVRLHFILLRDKEVLGVHLEDSVGRRWMMQDLA